MEGVGVLPTLSDATYQEAPRTASAVEMAVMF
jgi:hypothetical protein